MKQNKNEAASKETSVKSETKSFYNSKNKTWDGRDGFFYRFEKGTPEIININGNFYSQEEIMQDDILMQQLVIGNFSLIQKNKI